MTRKLQWVVIAVAAAIALGGGIYLGFERTAKSRQAIDSLYATSLPDLEMHQQAFSQWKNKTLLVNYWATWCEPCREEIPALIGIQARYSAKNLQIVGIALDSPDKVQAFAKSFGINYPLFIGGTGMMDLMRSQGNEIGALPFTLILSPGGAVTQTHLGGMSEQEMESMIAKAQGSSP
jgi:thiol-disulfide isomerase/thioredoxin